MPARVPTLTSPVSSPRRAAPLPRFKKFITGNGLGNKKSFLLYIEPSLDRPAGRVRIRGVEKRVYSLPEAARTAGVSEDELRCAIKDGLLLAELLQNTGEYYIKAQDLQEYIRRTRRNLEPGKVPFTGTRKKVLIIDDEINFANIMKLELERDPQLEAKFATWGRDGIMVAQQYQPDLILIDFMLPDITGDQVLEELHKIRTLKKTKVLVYSAHTRDAIKANPNLEQRLQQLGAEEFLSKSTGMRTLVIKVYEHLGIASQTKILRKPR